VLLLLRVLLLRVLLFHLFLEFLPLLSQADRTVAQAPAHEARPRGQLGGGGVLVVLAHETGPTVLLLARLHTLPGPRTAIHERLRRQLQLTLVARPLLSDASPACLRVARSAAAAAAPFVSPSSAVVRVVQPLRGSGSRRGVGRGARGWSRTAGVQNKHHRVELGASYCAA